jgi:hypothetical protein
MDIMELIKIKEKAKENNLYYDCEPSDSKNKCEFISCKEKSILLLEGFHVCESHGFRLIECIMTKMDKRV